MSRRSSEDDDDSYDDYSDSSSDLSDSLSSVDDSEYYMLHPRRGRALIFNFLKFQNNLYNTRLGSTRDVDSLFQTLSSLGFKVQKYINLTVDDLKDTLRKASHEDHSDADCLCVVVMTHGHEHGRLHAFDRSFEVSDMWSPFTADKCKTLAGKPKLFFVQACRGSRQDPGSFVSTHKRTVDSYKSPTPYKIPSCSDILLAFSSARGYSSVRDIQNGSWFIQCLCSELQENGRKHHLLTILTFVCQKVALNHETGKGEKQMPTVVSMLTRLLYFRPLIENKFSS